jgi:hypothetical protein
VATQHRTSSQLEEAPASLPPPVEDGTEDLEGFGRFVDELLGYSRRKRRAAARTDHLFSEEGVPDDPPPEESPPAVPGGNEVLTEGQPTEPGTL